MLLKSYVFRLVIVCLVGLFPMIGYSVNASAADVGAVAGKITGQRSKISLGNAEIKITDTKGKIVKIVKSDKDGTFVASGLPVGQYKVEAVKAGKTFEKKILVVKAPPVTQVNFQIPEKGYYANAGNGVWPWVIGGLIGFAAGVGTGLAIDDGSSSDDIIITTTTGS